MGYVKKSSLKHKDEGNPLIIHVVSDLFRFPDMTQDSRMSQVLADFAHKFVGYGEGGIDPTVDVHDFLGDFVHNAVDGVTYVLCGSQDQREGQKHQEGCFVVELEDHVVDAWLFGLAGWFIVFIYFTSKPNTSCYV